jgi:glycosyltransferase involved in cell wall biosynthesis
VENKKRKILFVMQLPPPVHGVSVMNKIIHDSKLINESATCHYVNLATARDIHDLQKNGFYKYILTFKIMANAIFKMITHRYDYVYVTIFPWGFAFLKDSLVVLLARLIRLKPILHLHTYGFKKNSQRSALRKWYYKFIFKKADVICLSQLLIEDIESVFTGKIFILPNGIPQVNFENTYNNAQDPLTLLYLSNLIKGKGILLIMDAVEQLKNRGYVFKFRVVGSEGDVDYTTLRELVIKKKLEDYVTLAGPKFGQEKYLEFKEAGIFLLPSNYDTFGLVLLEAMQFGVPCISTNMGGIPDVLGNGRGLIMHEISSQALEQAIESLLNEPAKRRLISEKSFDYFRTNFTVEVFEKRLLNILNGQPDVTLTHLMKDSL